MTPEGDDAPAAAEQALAEGTGPAPHARRPAVAATGAVLCLFDGSTAAVPRLRLAAEAALASRRQLVVAHVQTVSTSFWAAAFTGYGACLGPPEPLLTSSVEPAFAAAVLALSDLPADWAFQVWRGGGCRRLRRLAASHDAAVVVLRRRRLRQRLTLRRLRKDRSLTVLAVA